jgi:hypothetical protein
MMNQNGYNLGVITGRGRVLKRAARWYRPPFLFLCHTALGGQA